MEGTMRLLWGVMKIVFFVVVLWFVASLFLPDIAIPGWRNIRGWM
jgi:hypothetical protein